MKIKLFISFAAFVAASALMSSCSKEESTATTNDKLTAFTGGIVTEVPMERVQIGTPGGLTLAPGIRTRTSMNREKIGGGGAFLWERGDEIYVVDDNNKLCKSQNKITESAPRTTFLVDGTYTTKGQYDVYYYGTNTNSSAEEKKVVITDKQTQVAFNNTKHFGAVGDCGVAKATKTTVEGKSGYRFDLAHKASYICFLPYVSSQQDRSNFKLKRIEITSKADNISGTYNLTEDGLSGTGNSKTITLNVGTDGNGLELADKSTETKSINNSLYVVIAPGERKLSVKYTVFSVKDNEDLTLTQNYKSHNFAVKQICDIPVNIGSAYLYSGHNYYMWDAEKNYWSGHEWDAKDHSQLKKQGYPKSKSDAGARWYNDGIGAFRAFQNPLFKKLPNAQELAWYVMDGDPHWDKDKTWTAFGNTYHGGIWLKKLSAIAKKNGKMLSELTRDYPHGLNGSGCNFEISVRITKFGKPNDIKDYFFLPALGSYMLGTLYGLGSSGFYWSSSSSPINNDPFDKEQKAYSIYFTSTELKYGNTSNRNNGGVAQPFE